MKQYVLQGAWALLFCTLSTLTFAQSTVSSSTANTRTSNPFSTDEVQDITLYPNPSDGAVQVSLIDPVNESVTVKVYNRSGEEVYKHHVHFLDGKTELNVKHLQPGIYILHVITGDKTYTHYFSKL